jgi:uncharacterized protein YbgA (DUF1722 family)
MSHVFRVSDEQYAQLTALAAQQKQTPESLFQVWVNEVIQSIQEQQEEEMLKSPLLQVEGMFAIGEAGWADRHDEYLAQEYLKNHANEK